jgi:WD40 repeat protein
MSLLYELIGHKGNIWQLSFSPDGNLLASCSSDKTVKIWKFKNESWECIQTLSNHLRTIRSVSFSKSGDYLACGSFDSTVSIYYNEGGSKFILVNLILKKDYYFGRS